MESLTACSKSVILRSSKWVFFCNLSAFSLFLLSLFKRAPGERSRYSDYVLRAGRYAFESRQKQGIILFCYVNEASFWMDTGALSSWLSVQVLGLVTQLCIAPSLRMRGPIPPFLLYAFIVCNGSLHF